MRITVALLLSCIFLMPSVLGTNDTMPLTLDITPFRPHIKVHTMALTLSREPKEVEEPTFSF